MVLIGQIGNEMLNITCIMLNISMLNTTKGILHLPRRTQVCRPDSVFWANIPEPGRGIQWETAYAVGSAYCQEAKAGNRCQKASQSRLIYTTTSCVCQKATYLVYIKLSDKTMRITICHGICGLKAPRIEGTFHIRSRSLLKDSFQPSGTRVSVFRERKKGDGHSSLDAASVSQTSI